MQQTIFYVPHELAGVTVVGFGWLLLAWVLLSVVLLGTTIRRRGFDGETWGTIPVLLVVGVVIALVLPRLEVAGVDGVILGLPVRGYGLMFLLGVLAGVGLAVHLGRRVGIDSEQIYSLAFCMFIAGIVGARLYYIIQKWPSFQKDSLRETLLTMVTFTEGGLVVYGSVIGALAAFVIFAVRRRLPILPLADVIAPAMVAGLALGRIGCLFNGCCFGGLAADGMPSLEFPRFNCQETGSTSPPYSQHLASGRFHGIHIDDHLRVDFVAPGGAAEAAGLTAGTQVHALNGRLVEKIEHVYGLLAHSGPEVVLRSTEDRVYRWSVGELPRHSLPVHPTQVYSAINAGLLCLLLTLFFPFRKRDGQVFALVVTVYPITRFLLEMIRDDEAGVLGTPLTTSQVVSIITFASGILLWIFLAWQARREGQGIAQRKSAKEKVTAS